MGIDRPDEDDIPAPDEHTPDALDKGTAAKPGPAGDGVGQEQYHDEFRAKVDAVYMADGRAQWEAAKPGLAQEWRQYAHDHPAAPRAVPDVDQEVCAQVERGCKQIRETEENLITPAMLGIEAEDPERQLVGLQFRCKGQDRIMVKVAEALEEQSDLTPIEALASVKDTIRYTFQYTEEHYTESVYADSERLKSAGFELVELRNTWRSEEYKGINSRWRVPDRGQLFEVQFHTAISFEAKQLTHQAYERIRNPATPDAEVRELRAFQRKVNAEVPHPPGAVDVGSNPSRGHE